MKTLKRTKKGWTLQWSWATRTKLVTTNGLHLTPVKARDQNDEKFPPTGRPPAISQPQGRFLQSEKTTGTIFAVYSLC